MACLLHALCLAVFVTEDKEVIVTDGLKDMFTLTDSSYEQVEE